jgi:hypothetical protein
MPPIQQSHSVYHEFETDGDGRQTILWLSAYGIGADFDISEISNA